MDHKDFYGGQHDGEVWWLNVDNLDGGDDANSNDKSKVSDDDDIINPVKIASTRHISLALLFFNNNDSNSKVWHHLCIHFHFFWQLYQNINTNNYWWVNRCTESYCIIIKTNQININSSKSESLDAERPQSIDSLPPWRTCCALKLWRTALNSCNCCLKPAHSGRPVKPSISYECRRYTFKVFTHE